jgi:hypothetical protein
MNRLFKEYISVTIIMADKIVLKSFWDSLYVHPICKDFKEYFADLLIDILPNYKQVYIYSVFGKELPSINDKANNSDILYVQFSGEPHYRNLELFHINLLASLESDKELIIPHTLGGQHLFVHNLWERLNQPRIYENDIVNKTHFCSFIVSNGQPQERVKFYKLLNSYKQVDSCGRFYNTIGYLPPETDTPEYYEFMSRYKYTICFENSQIDYYFSEKLINAYISKTIPIYWGCPQVPDFINTKAIIYIPQASPIEIHKAYSRIIELENNPDKYKEIYEQPLFIDGKLPPQLDKTCIRNKITKAFNERLN